VTIPVGIAIEPLSEPDVARCAVLERVLFPGEDPWSAAAFREELRVGHTYLAARSLGGAPDGAARSLGGAPGDTARDGELLVAYGGIALVAGPPRAEAEIHTIGVDPAFQGRGIGRALLRGLLAVADAARATVFLEVRTDNDAARGLYESEGFAVVGLRQHYYTPSGADAHTMRRDPP
jgi:[ribosomal protein S18]-alanine N-acetyltransferase